MHQEQRRIYRHVQENPGVHFSAIVENLDLAVGQVQYHVRELLRDDTVVKEPFHGRTHYYPAEYDAWERGALAMLRRETARGIVAVVLEDEEIAPGEAADRLDIARSTLEWHASNLVERDVIEKRYDSNGCVYLRVPRPDDVEALLAEVSPRVHDRLVDRFTRFVDRALDGTPETAD